MCLHHAKDKHILRPHTLRPLSILQRISQYVHIYERELGSHVHICARIEGVHLSMSRKLHIPFDLTDRKLARTDTSDTFFSSLALD